MYKIKQRSRKNIIGLKLSGKLTRASYGEIVPILEKKIEEYGKIRLLIELDHWEGWGPYAALKDIAFVFKNSFKIERIAFLVKSKADREAVLLDQPFSPWFGDHTRYFAAKEKAAAWAWVEEGIVEPEVPVGAPAKVKVYYGPKMRVLIIGGSISGLTLAALLEQRGFRPAVVEAMDSLPGDPNIGILSPGSTGTLKALGIYKKVKKASVPFEVSTVLDKVGQPLESYNIKRMFENYGPCLTIPKNDLLQLIRTIVSPSAIRMATAATKLKTMKDAVQVTFSDGSTDEFDCVVCCDGVTSKMRELIFGNSVPVYTGMLGWAFSLEPDFETPSDITEYRSEGRFLRIYPKDEDVYVLAGVKTDEAFFDPQTLNIDLLRKSFAGFVNPVHDIIDSIENEEDVWHAPLYALEHDEWVDDRVALLGDAAFAFLPQTILGSALNLFTLESAFVLAEELCRTDSQLLPVALASYETRRHRRISEIRSLLTSYKFESLALSGDFTAQGPPSQEELTHFWQAVLSEPY